MRPVPLLALVLLLAVAIGAAAALPITSAASMQVFPVIPFEPPEPPPEETPIEWDGHGDEHQDPDCAGEVTWQFVLTGQPGGTEARLEVEFEDADLVDADGEQRGSGRGGAIHFEVTTPTGDVIEDATAWVTGDGGNNPVLALSETHCADDAADPDESDNEGEAPADSPSEDRSREDGSGDQANEPADDADATTGSGEEAASSNGEADAPGDDGSTPTNDAPASVDDDDAD